MREIFVPRNFKTKTLARIEQADATLTEYTGQGFTLTLRQLFYQFAAGQLVENTQANYDALGNEFRGALAKAAARDGQTSSAVVRKLVTDYLRSEGLWK